MSKHNLSTSRGLRDAWNEAKARVTGEPAPQQSTPAPPIHDLSTTKGLKASWEVSKAKVMQQQSPTPQQKTQTTPKRVELREKLERLREFDPEEAAAIE